MAGKLKIRSIALPVEHGGWGFLLEPILLALPIAGSAAGVCLAVTATATFLLRHPVKLFSRSVAPVSTSPRRKTALVVSMAYGIIVLGGLWGSVTLGGMTPLIPLLILSPFALVYLFFDTRKQSRRLLPVVAGPVGLAGMATAIALAGGWGWFAAGALWVILMTRTIPSIFYVKARLRLERNEPVGRGSVFVLHIVFGIVVACLSWFGYAPLLTLFAYVVLWVRAVRGLSSWRCPSKARRIGFLEIGYGLLFVTMTVVGFRLGF